MLGLSFARTHAVRRWVLSNLCWTLVCASWPIAWPAMRGGARAVAEMLATLIKHAPVFTTREVFHVGTRPAHTPAMRSASLEGPGLSVSHHPSEWTQIAKLGGLPTWALTRRDLTDGRFLAVHELCGAQRKALAAAFVDAGWLFHADRFVAVTFDDEFDAELESVCATLDEALRELDLERDALLARPRRKHGAALLTDDTEGRYALRRSCAVPTPALRTWWAQWFRSPLSDLLAWDMALARAVADHSGLDGLWWFDTLDPACYSAPRGVIVPGALPKWSVADAATPPGGA